MKPPDWPIWDERRKGPPVKSTYQIDYQNPATMSTATLIRPADHTFYWECIRNGPMKSTYATDFKKPTILFTTKLMTPVDHLFWNEKLVHKPVISTYQADYIKPATTATYDAASLKTGVHRPAIIEQWQWEEKVNLQNSHSDLLRAAQSERVVRFL